MHFQFFRVGFGAALVAALTMLPAATTSEPRLKVLILTGETDIPAHNWRLTTPFLRELLSNTGRFEVKALEEVRGLNKQILSGYDAVVVNYNGPRWGPDAEEALEQFLKSGKGMVAIHNCSYGTFFGQSKIKGRYTDGGPVWSEYADMLGSTWKPANVGHAPRGTFTVKWVDREHPISLGLEPSFVANDELYHKMDLRPNVHVLATAFDQTTGRDEPMVWTIPFGAGRVVHIPMGHDVLAMRQPGFVNTFARSVEWVATAKVTLPPGLTVEAPKP
jgi:type 1 glutamine amidotransferase